MALKARIATGADPTTPRFWFVMSMGLLVGFIVAYPMNWWLVANHLKHGMITILPAGAAAGAQSRAPSWSSIMRARSALTGWWEGWEVIRGSSLELKVAGPSMLGIGCPGRHALPLTTPSKTHGP